MKAEFNPILLQPAQSAREHEMSAKHKTASFGFDLYGKGRRWWKCLTCDKLTPEETKALLKSNP